MSVFVKNTVEIDEVNKEICRYEIVVGAKINRDKSVGLRLGRSFSSRVFQSNGRAGQDT